MSACSQLKERAPYTPIKRRRHSVSRDATRRAHASRWLRCNIPTFRGVFQLLDYLTWESLILLVKHGGCCPPMQRITQGCVTASFRSHFTLHLQILIEPGCLQPFPPCEYVRARPGGEKTELPTGCGSNGLFKLCVKNPGKGRGIVAYFSLSTSPFWCNVWDGWL